MKKGNKVVDKRKYFRIDDVAFLSYRVVSWGEVRSSEKTESALPVNKFTFKANLDRLSRELQPLHNVISSSNPNVARYLDTLDKKISLLSEYLLKDDEVENDVEPQQVNIGGGGLSFSSDKPVVFGAVLELKMKLLPEGTSICCYAKVISCAELEEGAELQDYKIAVEYEHMDDNVRDLITRHVFVKEQALINKA